VPDLTERQILIAVVTVILLVVIISLAAMLLRSKKKPPVKPERDYQNEGEQFAMLAQELIRTFKRVASENNKRLTKKANELQALLNEADRRKADLTCLLEKLPSEASPIAVSSPLEMSANGAEIEEPSEIRAEPVAKRVHSEREMLLGSPPAVPQNPPPTRRRDEVYRLADEGMEVEEIAQRTRMGKGEIGLILNLREKG